MLPTPSLLEPDTVTWLLRDSDGHVRAAVICWGIVLSTFIILRIRREVLLGCLIAGAATVGLAAMAVDIAPDQAIASSPAPVAATPLRGPAAEPVGRRYPR
jgi:hypothetical protein